MWQEEVCLYINFRFQMQSKQITHWSPEEELHYNLFLIFKADELLKFKNKATGFYVVMSQFIGTRNKVQCRSHHQKMVSRFKDAKKLSKPALERQNLNTFYRDHVELRLLDSSHLVKEIEYHLTKKLEKQIIDRQFYGCFKERALRNLEMLQFENMNKQQVVQVVMEEKVEPLETHHQKTPSQAGEYELSYLFPTPEEDYLDLVYFSEESGCQL